MYDPLPTCAPQDNFGVVPDETSRMMESVAKNAEAMGAC